VNMVSEPGSHVTPSKLLPQNIEAEEAVLGALLIDPDAIIRVATFLQAGDFHVQRHGMVYQAILDLHERREPADLVTLTDELERREQLSQVGGPAFLTGLINATPTSIHVEYYARIVERTAVLRRLIDAAGQIAKLAYQDVDDVDEVVDRAESIIFGVSEKRVSRDLVPIRQALDDFYDRIEYLREHQGEIIGIPTGLADLDKLLGGFQRSDLIIIAGRPGMGKTSLALSIALQAARRWNRRIGIFSMEMSNEQVVQRLVSAETGIDSQRLRLGAIHDDEWPTFFQATSLLSTTQIFIDDTPAISALEMRTKARRLHAEHGLDMIIVDYLQLMRGDLRSENRVQEISFISRSLKAPTWWYSSTATTCTTPTPSFLTSPSSASPSTAAGRPASSRSISRRSWRSSSIWKCAASRWSISRCQALNLQSLISNLRPPNSTASRPASSTLRRCRIFFSPHCCRPWTTWPS
jgi:replicative DNA helicase